jgi:hypothetical protein
MSGLAFRKRLKGLEGKQTALRHSRCKTCRDLREGQLWPRVITHTSEEEYERKKEEPKYKCPDCGWEPPDPGHLIIKYGSVWKDDDEDDEDDEDEDG